MRVAEREGIVRSTLLDGLPGLVHGFTTRALGSMAGSVRPADEQRRNREALERAIGLATVKPSQVHGSDVLLVRSGVATRLRDGASAPLARAGELEADALITREHGVALAVAVADCAPVLLATPEGWIGAAHAGWEGTTRGVVEALCRALVDHGAVLAEARAAVGPAIGVCCYAVRAERAAIITERLGDTASLVGPRADGHFDFDIPGELGTQLADAGVSRIDVLGRCTKDEVGTFFSHRGEDGQAGRGLAFIGWRDPLGTVVDRKRTP